MTSDPMDMLRRPVTPIAPSPAYAAELRRRIEHQLGGPPPSGTAVPLVTTDEGVAMSTITDDTRPVRGLTPYLAVDDARRAIDWYADVFGAQPASEPIVMDDDRVGHAELRIGDSLLYLADEFPEIGHVGPVALGGTSVTLGVVVDDCDTTVDRAVAAGAELEEAPADKPYGERSGKLRDPFGHRWIVSTPMAVAAAHLPTAELGERRPVDAPPGERHGDVGYFTLAVPDAERAQAFYGALLGWVFEPGRVEHGYQITGVSPHGGLWGGQEQVHQGGVTLCYRVDDVETAAARVRALGGTAEAPGTMPYGVLSECVDDQGTRFQLWQPSA